MAHPEDQGPYAWVQPLQAPDSTNKKNSRGLNARRHNTRCVRIREHKAVARVKVPIQHVIVKGFLCAFPNALQATCPDESNPHSLGVMLEGVYQLVCRTFIEIAHDIYFQVVIPPVHRHSEARRHDHASPPSSSG
jgi:hypothetical protein